MLGGTISNSGRYTAVSEWYNDKSGGGRLEGVSISSQGFDAPLRVGRTACFASSAGTTPVKPCDITDVA